MRKGSYSADIGGIGIYANRYMPGQYRPSGPNVESATERGGRQESYYFGGQVLVETHDFSDTWADQKSNALRIAHDLPAVSLQPLASA
jgi:hypothetical protein